MVYCILLQRLLDRTLDSRFEHLDDRSHCTYFAFHFYFRLTTPGMGRIMDNSHEDGKGCTDAGKFGHRSGGICVIGSGSQHRFCVSDAPPSSEKSSLDSLRQHAASSFQRSAVLHRPPCLTMRYRWCRTTVLMMLLLLLLTVFGIAHFYGYPISSGSISRSALP